MSIDSLIAFDNVASHTVHVPVIGIDEVGVGACAGPVVACALLFKQFPLYDINIKDSKKLSSTARDKVYTKILPHVDYGIGVVSNKIVDTCNVLQSTFLAMKKALDHLFTKIENIGQIILIDGNKTVPFIQNTMNIQKTIVKGDQKSISIASASIIAKITRDRFMIFLDKKYEGYGFSRHKGYCTKDHIKKVQLKGTSFFHRKTFKPLLHIRQAYV